MGMEYIKLQAIQYIYPLTEAKENDYIKSYVYYTRHSKIA